jgi:hypothetical protein
MANPRLIASSRWQDTLLPREDAEAAGTVTAEQSDDLLACLYGLYALLCLHFVQEEENFFVLAPTAADRL